MVALETSTTAPVISSAAPVIETTIVASPTGLCGLVPYSDSDFDSPKEIDSPEYITPLPATSPFLYTYSPEASDSSDGPPSQDLYAITIARWRSGVTTHSSSPFDFPIAPITAPPGTRRRAAILIRPGEAIPLGRPYRTRPNGPRRVMTARKRVGPLPAHRLAWRRVSPHSSDHHPSSSNLPTNSSPVHSSGLDTPEPRHSEAFRRWCAAPLSTFYPLTTLESSSGDSSERPLHSSSHPVRPSRKRCRSLADSVPSSTPVTGSLAPTCADLLPPRKRFRDSYSFETSMEEDTETDTKDTEDGRESDIVDGDDVRDHIEVDLRDDMEEFEASAGDKVVLGIDLRSIPMVDEKIIELIRGDSSSSSSTRDGTIRSVEDIPVDLDGAIHDFYHHMSKVRVDRIVGIETTQRQTMTNTRSGMAPAAIKEMINRRVAETLEAHEINMNHGLENENGNGNGNGNGGGNRNVDGRCDSNYPERYQVKYATCTLVDGALTWWNSHKRTIGTDAAYTMSWRELKKPVTEVYCPRNEIQKMETESWNFSVKNNDMVTYTKRFQELTMMCTKMVPEEEDRVDRFIEG
nr:reverse transcriptase domain-containing protein [Tanacetum cinerariifolium]